MSNDDITRKMEFIIDQQAQFSVDIQKLAERQKDFADRLDQFHRQQEVFHLELVELRGTANAAVTTARIALETATSTMEAVTSVAENVTMLAKAQARTDKQLKRLIRLFGAHISDGHGGKGV